MLSVSAVGIASAVWAPSAPAVTTTIAEPSGMAELLRAAQQWLTGLNDPRVSHFMVDWPSTSALRAILPTQVPVVSYLPATSALAPPSIASLVQSIVHEAAHFEWRRSYQTPAVSAQFMDNYGWTEWVGLRGPVPSERLACGLLLLGPGVYYPWHRHAAEELYLPLAGRAAWKRGDGAWQQQAPGSVIHHAAWQRHAMQTDLEPLLALYMWRGADLHQGSRLDDPTEAASELS